MMALIYNISNIWYIKSTSWDPIEFNFIQAHRSRNTEILGFNEWHHLDKPWLINNYQCENINN